MAYVIWCEGNNGNAGYFCYTTDDGQVAYTENIYSAKKFPTYDAAKHLADRLDYNSRISYTEIIKYTHDN